MDETADPSNLLGEMIGHSVLASMTGFGMATNQDAGVRVEVQVKSVNHKYLDVHHKLPEGWERFEKEFTEEVRKHVRRGRIDLIMRLEDMTERQVVGHVDEVKARAIHESLVAVSTLLNVAPPSLEQVVQIAAMLRSEIIWLEEEVRDAGASLDVARLAVTAALESLVQDRTREGTRLVADILAISEEIAHHLAYIETCTKDEPQRLKERIIERIAELGETELDPQRLHQEAAVIAERADVHEEIQRIGTHLDALRESLAGNEPVGRRVDFLCQELNREANTIGSKSAHAQVRLRVVDLKGAIERLREQARNLE